MMEGDFVKVGLPGETPWGELAKVFPDGSALIRIDNKTDGDLSDTQREARLAGMWGGEIPEAMPKRLHRHKYNDLLLCREDLRGFWAPVEVEENGQ